MADFSELTEGERFLCEFFKSEDIKFTTQVRIDKLVGDTKSFRVADFYLPKYKMYVEFFGYWYESDEHKAGYKEKMKVYSKNNIPCVYIFPENLGIIKYSFENRLKKELKKHNFKKELFNLNVTQMIDKRGKALSHLIILILFLIAFQFDSEAEAYWQATTIVGLLTLYPLFRIVSYYYKNFDE